VSGFVAAARRRPAVLGAVAAAIVIAAVAYLVFHHDHHKASKRPGLPAAGPQLDTGGLALASLLKAGRTTTYHARYTSKADASVSGGTIAIEAWNTQGKSRVDTTYTTVDGKVVHTASLLIGKKATACQQAPKASWTCKVAPTPADGDPAGLTASLIARLAGRSVTEHADKVGGQPARCFQVSAAVAAEAIDICVNRAGVLQRVVSPDARIEIAKLDSSVPDGIFTPPATPSG
jgi:hypothetical protein